jgi:hypothetical protein
VTFFTSPPHLLIHFVITKGDNFVSGIPPSLLFKTINPDQMSETSISSSEAEVISGIYITHWEQIKDEFFLFYMATWLLFCVQIKIPNVQNQKTKKESRLEEEIEVSDIWSGFIVLKSSEGGIPLTKLSPFVIKHIFNFF